MTIEQIADGIDAQCHNAFAHDLARAMQGIAAADTPEQLIRALRTHFTVAYMSASASIAQSMKNDNVPVEEVLEAMELLSVRHMAPLKSFSL